MFAENKTTMYTEEQRKAALEVSSLGLRLDNLIKKDDLDLVIFAPAFASNVGRIEEMKALGVGFTEEYQIEFTCKFTYDFLGTQFTAEHLTKQDMLDIASFAFEITNRRKKEKIEEMTKKIQELMKVLNP